MRTIEQIHKDLKKARKEFLNYHQQCHGKSGEMEGSYCDLHEKLKSRKAEELRRDKLGITFCAIEKAYYDEKVKFKKPISCHLYPVRVYKNKQTGFEALNYDQWDICNSACTYGKKSNIRVYQFAKEAIIRKYGDEFYSELEAAAEHLNKD